MKVLMLSQTENDYVFSALDYGLCEILGGERVLHYGCDHGADDLLYLRSWFPSFKRLKEQPPRARRIQQALDGEFSALFVCEAYSWRRSWETVIDFLNRVPQETKIVYVIGHDGLGPFPRAPFRVDKTFQREIHSEIAYDYQPLPLYMALPKTEIASVVSGDRSIEVAYIGHSSSPLREEWLSRVIASDLRYVVGRGPGLLTREGYMEVLRRAKFALCPPGAGWDCMRTWEATAAGCVPVFLITATIKQPDFYAPTEAVYVGRYQNPAAAIRKHLGAWAGRAHSVLRRTLLYHTTERRARYVLDATFGAGTWK